MSLTIHSISKYFDSTIERAEDTGQKFHFCRLPFAVNVMLNLSIVYVIIRMYLVVQSFKETGTSSSSSGKEPIQALSLCSHFIRENGE